MLYSFDPSRSLAEALAHRSFEGDLFVAANILRYAFLVNTLDKLQEQVVTTRAQAHPGVVWSRL
jgi:hypothetical protein